MARFVKDRSAKQGKYPGEMVFIGRQKTEKLSIRTISYTSEIIHEYLSDSVQQAWDSKQEGFITWFDITGLHDTESIGEIGKFAKIHPLTLEDITNTGQRPKVEEFNEYVCIMVKVLRLEPTDDKIHGEHLSIILGSDYVITFQERPNSMLDPLRERLRTSKGRLRRLGADYLVYTILDTVVDNYLLLIQQMGIEIEELDQCVSCSPAQEKKTLEHINRYRQELQFLRTAIRPSYDALRELTRLDCDVLHAETAIFYRDLYDLEIQAVEELELYREILKDQMEIHNATLGNRLNEIMKFLTVFSVIFIPLTFIAGVYGTNFEYMPELTFRYGYPIFLGVLFFVALGMIIYFKRKKWL